MEKWSLSFTDWDPDEELLRETLLTLGNGYFATRGAAEESIAGTHHYPGCYLAGGYNRLFTTIEGKSVENEDLVNCPNWLPISFRHEDENWFNLSEVRIISYQQNLDMKNGEVVRRIRFSDSHNRESELCSSRIVSMDNPHIAAIRWELRSLNWSGKIEIKSFIDGGVTNAGVARYKLLSNKHLIVKSKKVIGEEIVLLESMMSQSLLHLSQAIRTTVNVPRYEKSIIESPEQIGIQYIMELQPDETVALEKIMTFYTSRDRAISNSSEEAVRLISRLPSYSELRRRHILQWDRLWSLCDIEIGGNVRENRLMRLHIFHLLQTISLKSIDLDVGVPARGLHGEAYRGHIFWDELFILPFLNLRIPELSRSLLLYRFRRLDDARANAKAQGFKGALYPWQSGSNGEEQSQIIHLNPISGRWIGDATFRQRHINSAIFFNIWQYYQATGDKNFLSQFGVEMALEISRFWISTLTFNQKKNRYEILNVVGPDEFHTKYPGSDALGINNNTYTNYMASWCIRTTIELFLSLASDRQEEILSYLELTKIELAEWQEKSKKIFIPMRDDGILNQFEGFEKLEPLDLNEYCRTYGNIQRIDRILESNGMDVNNYQVNKQADVLMLFYLFSEDELLEGFQWMNYSFKPDFIKPNIDHHLNLSSHGSTLSRIVHAWVMSKYDIEKSWELFERALETDVADIQGGTSHEGIHLGAMAGTIDLIQRCFSGISVSHDTLWINPNLPHEILDIDLLIHFRGHSIDISVSNSKLIVKIKRSWIQTGKIGINGQVHDLEDGKVYEIFDKGDLDGIQRQHHVQ